MGGLGSLQIPHYIVNPAKGKQDKIYIHHFSYYLKAAGGEGDGNQSLSTSCISQKEKQRLATGSPAVLKYYIIFLLMSIIFLSIS